MLLFDPLGLKGIQSVQGIQGSSLHRQNTYFSWNYITNIPSLSNISNLGTAVSEAAQASVRDQLSRATFDEVPHDRESAGKSILSALCDLTAKWGVLVDAVRLKNIRVDESMIRAMGRVAEAERVRAARLIEASAELDASRKLVQAGKEFGSGNGEGILGLHLREMQNHAQIAAEKNITEGSSLQSRPRRMLTVIFLTDDDNFCKSGSSYS